MRIAVVNQHPSDVVGGSELQCDLVARGLVARGHDVTYVAVTSSSAARPDPHPDAPYALQRVAPDADAIVAACVASRADVVYWRMNRPTLPGVVRGLREHRIPLVFAIAHADDVARWPVRPWPRAGTLRDHLHELRVRLRHRRSWAAFSGVDAIASQRADLIGRAPVARQQLVRNLMVEDAEPFDRPRPYIAWVGSLQQRKRPELLPAVADAVAPLGVDVVVAGGLRDDRYRALVESPGARPNLQHVGILPQAQVVGLLAGARALVMTAHEEGFANVLLQAWWHGTPTVSLGYDPDATIATHDLGAACDEDVARFLREAASVAAVDGDEAARRRAHIMAFARSAFAAEPTLDMLERLLDDVRR